MSNFLQLQVDIYEGFKPYDFVDGTTCPNGVTWQGLTYKKAFKVVKGVLKRDIVNKQVTELTVYDESDVVIAGDLVYMHLFIGEKILNFAGIITSANYEKDGVSKKLSIYYGADAFMNKVPVRNTNTFDMSTFTTLQNDSCELFNVLYSTSMQNIIFRSSVTDNAVTNGNNISGEKLFTQLFRKYNVIESSSIDLVSRGDQQDVETLAVDVSLDINQNPITIDLNDSIYGNLEINISEQQENQLIVFVQNADGEATSPTHVSFMDIDGNVYTNELSSTPIDIYNSLKGIQLKTPIVSGEMEVNYEDAVDVNLIVEDYFKSKEYSNEILFDISLDILDGENFIAWDFDQSFLGRKLIAYLPNRNQVKTLVSSYELDLESGIIKIKCGLSRTNLTDLLKGKEK